MALDFFLGGGGGGDYLLADQYLPGQDFFSGWSFFNRRDPTKGFVEYVDRDTAFGSGMVREEGETVYIGVDSATVNPLNGRRSVRITTDRAYNVAEGALVVLDVEHMPGVACGPWPAAWLLGTGENGERPWPCGGEKDIIEGVHTGDNDGNTIVTHSSDSCLMAKGDDSIENEILGEVFDALPDEIGDPLLAQILQDDTSGICKKTNSHPDHVSCRVDDPNSHSYGHDFNENKGGVFVTEFEDRNIRTWFFPRYAIPRDITEGKPRPKTWGTPVAHFEMACNIQKLYSKQRIIINTTFCGDWAGSVWSSNPTCAPLAPTCAEYVAANPSAYEEAFWKFKSVKVYMKKKALEAFKNTPQKPAGPDFGAVPDAVLDGQQDPVRCVG